MALIDAHHHLWHPARGDYGWMPADDPILSRPYTPADLECSLRAAGIARTVLVQAAPTVEETEYLLGIADATPWVAGVVGWIDFERPETQAATLERLAQHPKLVGIRPMIQDLPDPEWMLRDDVQWAYCALSEHGLAFDCLGFPQHLAPFHTLLSQHPSLRTVIDHCMKPQLRAHNPENFAHWADGMSRLANETSAFCKLSGLVTEADEPATLEMLKPYVDHVLEAFGPARLMWGSDWPVARLACAYRDWFDLAQSLTKHVSQEDQALIFGGTAAAFYGL